MDTEIRKALREQRHEEHLKSLITGILRQAALDIRVLTEQTEDSLTQKVLNAADALEFVNSDFFTLICDALKVNESVMRNEILRRTKRGDLDD